MAIQVRRGNEADFDASKLLPGEWAVSLDTKYVRMCFAPGIVLRMATYEGFESETAQIQAILAECKSIQAAVQRIQSEVNAKASLTIEYSNSAKGYADSAYADAERAKVYAENAEAVTNVQIATMDRAGLIKGGDNYIAEDGTLTLITTTTSTTQPNSYAGRLKVDEIGGVMEQDNTEGNQLFDGNLIGGYYQNGAYVDKTDVYKTIKLDVTALDNYTFSFGTKVRVIRIDGAEVGVEDTVFTYQFGSGTHHISFRNLANTAWDNSVKVMVNSGTTALPYEPYTGGQPAPNPSYPQEIKKSVVSGVKTHWKNFFKADVISDTALGITHTVKEDGTCTLNGTATADRYITLGKCYGLKPNTAYIVSGNNATSPVLRVRTFDANGNILNSYISSTSAVTFTTEGQFSYADVYVIVYANTTLNNFVVSPMIREVGTDATYEPYTESAITFSQPIELYGKDDVQDILTPQNVGRKFVKLVLDANKIALSGYYEATNTNRFIINTVGLSPKVIADGLMCNIAKANKSGSNANTCRIYSDLQTFLFLDADEFPDKASLETYLETNEVYFVYELATETTEALPIADQIALNSLQTYDGITYVEIDSEIQPTFKAEYGTSKVGGYTLEGMLAGRNGELYGKDYNSRLSALEASVVNNI